MPSVGDPNYYRQWHTDGISIERSICPVHEATNKAPSKLDLSRTNLEDILNNPFVETISILVKKVFIPYFDIVSLMLKVV